jgi:hypothetical protein
VAANAEQQRLDEDRQKTRSWRKWGPYLSDRQWGTVREDYSADGAAWEYFSHDQARSRAYRWGEDGIAGISDNQQLLCFSLALWNGHDPILKERYFGLTGNEGNHGEDCKELYYYLDATPTNSYLKMLYKYPQRAFPYAELVEENRRRGRAAPEYELIDTGAFNESRYFDVFVEYAKADPDEILIQITAFNRGPDETPLHLLPQVWFRNTWSWDQGAAKPRISAASPNQFQIHHPDLGDYRLYAEAPTELLFCDNDTNTPKLYGSPSTGQFFKDGFHDYLIKGNARALNPDQVGTKAAAHYRCTVGAGSRQQIRLRLCPGEKAAPFVDFDAVMGQRKSEADDFYADLQSKIADPNEREVQRQALAGMLWSKQFYYFDVARWLDGDPAQPPPPPQRKGGRNADWPHHNAGDVISMPDKWEYPWYAAWDLAFHCVPLAMVDPDFAKQQLLLLTKEWYMHPNGQLPAYEWRFGDVNPPVHAWAAWQVYHLEQRKTGQGDRVFLERVFHKLLLNFTWWVNRKDVEGRNIFQGGFLGLDNIGVFDRSARLPTGGHINQCDGTSWMAMYCLNLMRIALELSAQNSAYEDLATKFFEHFLYIADALTDIGGRGIDLWSQEDEFYYDVLCLPDGRNMPLTVRSMVGIIPLFAVEVLDPELLAMTPKFGKRLEWFLEHRPDLAKLVSRWHEGGRGDTRLLSLLRGHRIKRLLKRMLDESEFLSPYGIRALSKHHESQPYRFETMGQEYAVTYEPAESDSGLFGGNSNWRGPIWMPVNYLIVESLRRFHKYYGDDFTVECPTGSGKFMNLHQVADEIADRLKRIFLPDAQGRRAVYSHDARLYANPEFNQYLLFHEYFHGDTGRGVGASHQTGWTGLIAALIAPHEHPHAKIPDAKKPDKEPAPAQGAKR